MQPSRNRTSERQRLLPWTSLAREVFDRKRPFTRVQKVMAVVYGTLACSGGMVFEWLAVKINAPAWLRLYYFLLRYFALAWD